MCVWLVSLEIQEEAKCALHVLEILTPGKLLPTARAMLGIMIISVGAIRASLSEQLTHTRQIAHNVRATHSLTIKQLGSRNVVATAAIMVILKMENRVPVFNAPQVRILMIGSR